MSAVAHFFLSGHAVDLALTVMCAEAAFLLLFRERVPGRPSPGDIITVLLPGACLLLALRAALVGNGTYAIAGLLLAALGAHVFDLRRRWR
jgi:hypothetical protein